MTEQTPSQAEGEPQRGEPEESGRSDVPRTTPSQAEGDREDADEGADDAGGREGGRSAP